eukprot:1159330-Pelagomonas_calceolata.AAC.1
MQEVVAYAGMMQEVVAYAGMMQDVMAHAGMMQEVMAHAGMMQDVMAHAGVMQEVMAHAGMMQEVMAHAGMMQEVMAHVAPQKKWQLLTNHRAGSSCTCPMWTSGICMLHKMLNLQVGFGCVQMHELPGTRSTAILKQQDSGPLR